MLRSLVRKPCLPATPDPLIAYLEGEAKGLVAWDVLQDLRQFVVRTPNPDAGELKSHWVAAMREMFYLHEDAAERGYAKLPGTMSTVVLAVFESAPLHSHAINDRAYDKFITAMSAKYCCWWKHTSDPRYQEKAQRFRTIIAAGALLWMYRRHENGQRIHNPEFIKLVPTWEREVAHLMEESNVRRARF
jgi:hypothetical protein